MIFMMGGEGHILDMNNRIKNNRAMLQDRRDRIRTLQEMYKTHIEIQTRKSPESVNLEHIKTAIRKELRQQKRRARLKAGVILILIGTILVFLFLYLPYDNFIKTFNW